MKICKSLLAFIILSIPSFCSATQESLKEEMIQNLEIIQHTFEVKYAPAEWKKNFLNWDLDTQIEKAKETVLSKNDITLKEYHSIVRKLLKSTQDHHVGVIFYSTSAAFLPFRIQGAEGKYFVVWKNNKKIKDSVLRLGDEILTMNGESIHSIVDSLITSDFGDGDSPTERALATVFVTARVAAVGMEIPDTSKPVTFEVKRGDAIKQIELSWEVIKEEFEDGPFKKIALTNGKKQTQSSSLKDNPLLQKKMIAAIYEPLHNAFNKLSVNNDEENEDDNDKDDGEVLATKKSNLPILGKVIWQAGEKHLFHAYLFKMGDHKIGYIRIPHYNNGLDNDKYAKKFANVIKIFEENSDALIIDQLNNPGGSVLYTYALASMLSPEPLQIPTHRATINQEDVFMSKFLIDFVKFIKKQMKEADEEIESTIDGYPATKKFLNGIIRSCNFTISEWNEGRDFTNPHYVLGIKSLSPHPWGTYSKPILLLVNELDFSGGDFFPAILQDNKRAVIMGERTAGAGGVVNSHSYPNRLGIAMFAYTATIAERLNKQPIENLGVTPDIHYEVTANDLQNGYKDYAKAIRQAVKDMLKK